MLSEEQGIRLINLARFAVECCLSNREINFQPCNSPSNAGVFVSLYHKSLNAKPLLRGCIGFVLPQPNLDNSVIAAATAAATRDPRFAPVTCEELGNIIFEISILRAPIEIKVNDPSEYLNQIRIGKDGLILEWEYGTGLLLPQVPVELLWNVEDYLANLCHKAGAPIDIWRSPNSKIYKFQAIVFTEVEPKGNVTRIDI
jgi:uncharacterized protein (TIGR00296 family)